MEHLFSSLHLNNCSSKLKVEELFTEYCVSEECKEDMAHYQRELAFSSSSSSSSSTALGKEGFQIHSPQGSFSHPLVKKSPKKRTHEDILQDNHHHSNTSINEGGEEYDSFGKTAILNENLNLLSPNREHSSAGVKIESHAFLPSSSSPHHASYPSEGKGIHYDAEEVTSTRRRANFDHIPIFFLKETSSSQVTDSSKSLLSVMNSPKSGSTLSQGSYPKSTRIEEDQLNLNPNKLVEIESLFQKFNDAIPCVDFVDVTKYLCGFPSYLNRPLVQRIHTLYTSSSSSFPSSSSSSTVNNVGPIKLSSFIDFWNAEIAPFDHTERLFRLLKQPSAEYIEKDDFVPCMQELLELHPGLDFLESHEEFQKKYALTVITRYKKDLIYTLFIFCIVFP